MPHDCLMALFTDRAYSQLLDSGRHLYPGVRIGRPGRARTYWATIAGMRLLRLRWKVVVIGADHVAPGAAILVGNHVSAMDPVATVMSQWWRVTAFAKVEVFQARGAIFFRLMGQIPLRRGDEESTTWALAMAASTLADGNKVGVYPEGTRSPDPLTLHRLHPRVLVPLLKDNPGVPVHAITTTYPQGTGRRRIDVAISAPLSIDPQASETDITDAIRDALLALADLEYVDESAATVKRRMTGAAG